MTSKRLNRILERQLKMLKKLDLMESKFMVQMVILLINSSNLKQINEVMRMEVMLKRDVGMVYN